MKKKYKASLFILLVLGVTVVAASFLRSTDIAILSPGGTIAAQQRDLLVFATLLSLIVILPVFALTFWIAWKYRANRPGKKAKYTPDWDSHKGLELVWWGIPCLIILVLGVVAWKSSHSLDPYRPIQSDKKPLVVQVVALPWKWLFIYPQQGIASVNYVQFPEDTPISFEITADAPMNSFWIPQLGGQVYAMAGMTTKLHLMADNNGTYQGASANLSGEGFADMQFVAKSTSQKDFDAWTAEVQASLFKLDLTEYDKLADPSTEYPTGRYTLADKNLHTSIVMKYMMPEGQSGHRGH
jgi:cytochrome o ubiquinol oxidase subunit 2